ncbi:MAG TPA: LytTR family DNA-binding domain-containing protein [Chitinophagaceae bacterium]|nr:LytTR family DNA-binding domain-containing protein [Chitinophagaceae bacterium]
MKLLLIDNEPNIRSGLREMILSVATELPSIEEADGVQNGLQKIKSFSPDVVFLDIEMDDGTGFDLLNHIPNPSFQLIFTTAHDQYAIQAFKFSAIDYLLKPVDPDDLRKSLERAATHIRTNDLSRQLTVLMQQLSHKNDHERRIVLKDIDSTYFIRVSDILFCQADGTYTKFHISNTDPILVSKNLKEYETLLEPLGFLRTHHSFLANPDKIKMYDKTDGGSLILEGDIRIPLSQRKKDFILAILEKKV